jgi:outer membrane protein OmpA-like peptidoglycan-associated protein
VAHGFRTVLAVSLLLAGVVYSLPTQVDSTETGATGRAHLVQATFQVAARRNILTIAGHTRSANHELTLRRLAEKLFPHFELRFEFRPMGLVPDWWNDATAGMLRLVATTIAPTATLGEDTLQVAALVRNQSAVAQQLRLLHKLLPDAHEMQVRLRPAVAQLPESELCKRQFAAFEAGPIQFEESGTVLRTSAFPVLDRIVTMADACRSATVTVTGHTDSSGPEGWNRQLSFERAGAVAAYLTERGLRRDRILTRGAGSSTPVANNATRFGRSLNRRIEVQFAYSD